MNALARARALLAEAFHVDPSEIPDDARIGELEQWDSLGHARLLLSIEEAIKRPLDPMEVISAESLVKVAELVDSAAPK